jgi:putative transposase
MFVAGKPAPTFYDQNKDLALLKQTEGYAWLADLPAKTLTLTLNDLAEAYKRAYKKISKFPKRKKFGTVNTFTVPMENEKSKSPSIRDKDGKLIILKFNEGIRYRGELPDNIRSATISKCGNRYYASIAYEKQIQKSEITGNHVGIDLGLKTQIVCSDGTQYNRNNKKVRQKELHIKRTQRLMAKSLRMNGKKRTNNYKRNQKKLQRLNEQIRFIETDFLHKATTEIVRKNDIVSMEDLNTKGMMKNHHCAKALANARFRTIRNMVEYKCKWFGKTFQTVGRFFPSSQMCPTPGCGYRNRALKDTKIRHWKCPQCGQEHERDPAAAVNIDVEGLRLLSTAGDAGTYEGGGVQKPRIIGSNWTQCEMDADEALIVFPKAA